jgi:thioredoxin-related protein
MMIMKTVSTAVMVMMMAGSVWAGSESWETDFAKAKAKAAEKNLPILVVFSGSDWCGWCQKLEREVWGKDEFKTFAAEALVLFLADFPQKAKLSEVLDKQNKELADKYGVKGFPTVILLDKEGKEKARTGYKPGGAEEYVKHLKTLIEGK